MSMWTQTGAACSLAGKRKGISLCTTTSSWVFFLVVSHYCQVESLLIDPQAAGGDSPASYTYCAGSDEPLRFKNPVNPNSLQDSKYISFTWFFIKEGEEKEKKIVQNVKGSPMESPEQPDKYSLFDTLGLQVQNVNFQDSGTYRAKLVMTSDPKTVDIKVVVSRPPKLSSEKLSLTEEINENDQSKTLKCGQISDLGEPPVEVPLKAENGTVLPAEFINGYMMVTLNSADKGNKFTCELDSSSPAGKCIAEEDLPRWEGSVVESSSTDSAGTTGIIIGVVVSIVVGVILIIVLVVLIRRRRKNGDKYNTKEHEARVGAGNGDKESPLLSGGDYDTPRTNKPIYTGPATTSPYMVSPVHQNIDPKSKKIKPPVATPDEEDEKQPFNSVKYTKKGQESDKKNDAKPETPRAKPRSIFLTNSSEELDKIGRAVAGGEGSGAKNDGTMV